MAAKWTDDAIPDQSGRTVVVTGANSGLGAYIAHTLVAKGARVLMACRSPERGAAAVVEAQQVGAGRAELVVVDLAELESVRAAAERIRELTGDQLDVLVNNAGVMATPLRRTADGFELQLAANHIGHAALTWQLMPALRGRPAARVVSVSSILHHRGRIDLADLHFERRRYRAFQAYTQAKLANLLFAFELDRRARAAGMDLVSVAAHPGLAHTQLASNMIRTRGSELFAEVYGVLGRLTSQPAARGALPLLYAATAPDVAGGDYYGPDGFRELRGHPRKVGPSRLARDPDLATEFWQATADMTKVKPDPA